MLRSQYDIVVVGAGHAGVEAAAAAARLGASTLLVTFDLDQIGRMSCNPSIGGLGKGHLVREIDALGGVMALAADATCIQFRMLNMRKGPAVRAPRAQADKIIYPIWLRDHLENNYPHLTLAQGEVERIRFNATGHTSGVDLMGGETVAARAVIVTAGTYLNGLIHLGMDSRPGGRWGESASVGLAESLHEIGLQMFRLKTGTPARLQRESIQWDALEQQHGDDPPPPFSYLTDRIEREQTPCAITYTNPRTHEIINTALDRSPLFTGKIVGVGPRYCPSIETKLKRFPDRDRHQIFLEPESLHNSVIYVNGVSTSLPPDTQEAFLHSVVGLERVEILRPGYGIEYDAYDPRQMRPTLECRDVPGLYLAGQLNGTTGYEEAAGLGLIAGANAALKIQGKKPLTFRRDEAYLGVMIDDLLTKGAPEPYRLFTSRAEYRLLLRQDNADLRLTERGHEVGLVNDARWERFVEFREAVDAECSHLSATNVKPAQLPVADLESEGVVMPRETMTLERFLVRSPVTYDLMRRWGLVQQKPERVAEQVELRIKYAGYIKRQKEQILRTLAMETTPLAEDFDYHAVASLRHEAALVLSAHLPTTMGQASRLPGVNPADITAILIHLRMQAKR